MQLFSCYPVHVVERPDQVPSFVKVLYHCMPKTHSDFLKLRILADYLQAMVPFESAVPGITVIKRMDRRRYDDHDQLVSMLGEFGMPVREAVMETLSFHQQIHLMRKTRVLVGPHGVGETNMMFMPQGSQILELCPMGFSGRVFRVLAKTFGHYWVELESEVPGVIGRKPTKEFLAYVDQNGWPLGKDVAKLASTMEFKRVLRDVTSFSVDPAIVVERLRMMLKL